MEAEFITLDSKLVLKKGTITEKKLKHDTQEGSSRTHAFIALVAFLLFSLYAIIEEQKYFHGLQVLLILVWMEPYVKRTYRTLFIQSWKSYFKLLEVKSVTAAPLENGLETKVVVKLSSGRQKEYVFRNAEKQADEFVQAISASLQPQPSLA